MKPRRHSVCECVLPFCISFALEIPTAWPAMEYEAPMQRCPSVTRSRSILTRSRSIFDRRPSDRSNAPSMDRRHSLHKHRKGPSPQARGVRGRGHKVSWYIPSPSNSLEVQRLPQFFLGKLSKNIYGDLGNKTWLFWKLVSYWLATNGNKSPCKIRLSLNGSQVGNVLLIWFQPKFGGGIGVAECHCRWLVGMCQTHPWKLLHVRGGACWYL